MSINPRPIPLADADRLAAALRARLEPHCRRFEVAGSIRRRKLWIGDIEIVAIPTPRENLLGEPIPGSGPLYDVIDRLLEEKLLTQDRPNQGQRFKQYRIVPPDPADTRHTVGVDLFLVTPETWGFQLAIRTGPEDFSKAIVTSRRNGGLLSDQVHPPFEGRVRSVADDPARGLRHGQPLDVPEERDYLELCGGWIEPKSRGAPAVAHIRHKLGLPPATASRQKG